MKSIDLNPICSSLYGELKVVASQVSTAIIFTDCKKFEVPNENTGVLLR